MDNLPPQPNTQDLKQTQSQPQSISPSPQPPIPEVVIQPQQPKKKPILKIFAVLAIFLFLVLASEVVYYFATTKRQEKGEQPLSIPQQFQPERVTSTPTPPAGETEGLFGGTIDFEKVDETLAPLRDFTKSVYQKGEIKLVYGGKVTEITTDEEEKTHIRMLTTTLPTEEYGAKFSKDEIENIIVLSSKDGETAPIDFTDIEIGDKIKITETYNILDKQGEDLTIIKVERGGE